MPVPKLSGAPILQAASVPPGGLGVPCKPIRQSPLSPDDAEEVHRSWLGSIAGPPPGRSCY